LLGWFEKSFNRLRGRFGSALQSDAEFIESAYREILGRNADLDGLNHYLRLLKDGLGRTSVLLSLVTSDEYRRRLAHPVSPLPNLRVQRPDSYRAALDKSNGQTIQTFCGSSAEDFDWLETQIIANGYYEQPGVWVLGVDADKRIIAEMIATLTPHRPIELGCAAGAVIARLEELGVRAEGVEISAMALARAPSHVRDRIHQGDLLSLELPQAYDLVFGLDIFEHLNPNRLDKYLEKIAAISTPEAVVFCNIPAFGEDEIFGTVFPLYIEGWADDAAAGRPFRQMHVDELGYPLHGHLTWADARWWRSRFQSHGFHREVEIERAFHRKYDAYMRKRAPARQSYFIFSRNLPPQRAAAIIAKVGSERSEIS